MQVEGKPEPVMRARGGIPKAAFDFVRRQEKLLFVVASGVGWVIDFVTFNIAVYVFHVQPFAANYLSSVAGSVFAFSVYCLYSAGTGRPPGLRQIATYVCYQVASISFYSLCVGWLASTPWIASSAQGALITKIIITPFNFITNYLATRTVLKFMKPPGAPQ